MTTTSEPLSNLLNNVGAPVDDDPKYQGLLRDLQANILSSHGKPEAHYILLRFADESVVAARQLLALLAHDPSERERAAVQNPQLKEAFAPLFDPALASVQVSSEFQVSEAGRKARKQREEAGPFPVMVMLSACGYEKLGARSPEDPVFRGGMPARGGDLNDPPRDQWEEGYEEDLHALVIVAFDSARASECNKIVDVLVGLFGASVVRREQGFSLRNKAQKPVEPFGFRDNLSQPVFYAHELARVEEFQGKAATVRGGRWRSFEPLNSVLVPDPGGTTEHACGTYVVFRKLRQDVEKFSDQVKDLAHKLDRSPDDIAADLVGRTRDGRPLAAAEDMNDFDFSDGRCPLHAHIRKANPREEGYKPHARRIVRRGLIYKTAGDGGESGETGLLFLCAQSNIKEQFETIQQWLSNTKGGGPDPIAGQPRQASGIALRNFRGEAAGRIHVLAPVVSLKGGEYFFTPSIGAIKKLL